MHPFTTPSFQTWLAHAATAAREAGVPVGAIVGGALTRPVCRARWKAWKAVLDSNPAYSIAGLGRTCGWNHSSIILGLRRLNGVPADSKVRKSYYMRRIISDELMRQNAALDMTAEEFAEATGKPLSLIIERAKAAGIVFKRESPFKIAKNVRKATAEDPREPCVRLPLLTL